MDSHCSLTCRQTTARTFVESVDRDGFERLAAALAPGTHEPGPLEGPRELARAYRRFGLANRTLYAAVFSRFHGQVSLEISGHFTDDAPAVNARFETLVAICLTGLSRPSLHERMS